ncbi:hypothetical protein DB346_14715 [Verrucomicrobia bacterium LW23]|nr:hypothetical protein DB346_14715 [Verrucomicrobia bacterium LW23]
MQSRSSIPCAQVAPAPAPAPAGALGLALALALALAGLLAPDTARAQDLDDEPAAQQRGGGMDSDAPLGPPTPPAEWHRKESVDRQFMVESQDTRANLLLMEAAEEFHGKAQAFLDLPKPWRHRVYIQANKIDDISEYRPAVIAAGLSRGLLQFKVAMWYPAPQAKEELLRALATIFIYEKLLSARSTWQQGEVLPPLPLWLTEGVLQNLLDGSHRQFYQIVNHGYSNSRAPKLETIAAWTSLSDDPVYRIWQQAFSYYLVNMIHKGHMQGTLPDWLAAGANLSPAAAPPSTATTPTLAPAPATPPAAPEGEAAPAPALAPPAAPPSGAPYPRLASEQEWEKLLIKADDLSKEIVYTFEETAYALALAENMDLEDMVPIPGAAPDPARLAAAEQAQKEAAKAASAPSVPTAVINPKTGKVYALPEGMRPITSMPGKGKHKKDDGIPREKKTISVRIDSLASRRGHPGLPKALNGKIAELTSLELRAHFAWRPVIAIYRQALINLAHENARPSYESLITSANNARKQLTAFRDKVSDYMNWYIVRGPVSSAEVAGETFADYVHMRQQLEKEEKTSPEPTRRMIRRLLGPNAKW